LQNLFDGHSCPLAASGLTWTRLPLCAAVRWARVGALLRQQRGLALAGRLPGPTEAFRTPTMRSTIFLWPVLRARNRLNVADFGHRSRVCEIGRCCRLNQIAASSFGSAQGGIRTSQERVWIAGHG